MPPAAPAIVFISGAFVTSACWDNWRPFFEGHGYTCHAPAWPHNDAPAAALHQQHPHSPIAANGLQDVLRVYIDFIAALPTPPIVIGHSYGGLLVQLLVQRGVVAAGVAILPAVANIHCQRPASRPATPALRAAGHARVQKTNPAGAQPLGAGRFQPAPRAAAVPRRWGRPPDARRPQPRQLRRYRHAGSVRSYHELPGRCHAMLGQATWPEDTALVLRWLQQLPA